MRRQRARHRSSPQRSSTRRPRTIERWPPRAASVDHAPHHVSVEAKRDPDAVADFVAGVRNATACWTRPPRARVLDRGRAILKPGIAPKPFVPIRYDPGGSHRPFSPRSALCGGIGRSRRAPHCVAVSAFVRDPKNATRRLMTTGRRMKREYGRRTGAPRVLPGASGT